MAYKDLEKMREKGRERKSRWRLLFPEKNKEIKRRHYLKNRETIIQKVKEYTEKNKEKIRARHVIYRAKNRDKINAKMREYSRINRREIYLRDYPRKRARLKNDVEYKLLCLVRGRISDAIRGKSKSVRTRELLGCSIKEFRMYIEGQFKDGMSWENHGVSGWHLDHKIPLSFFNLSDESQLRQACHYSNLQPLWASENLRKSNKVL